MVDVLSVCEVFKRTLSQPSQANCARMTDVNLTELFFQEPILHQILKISSNPYPMRASVMPRA